MANEKDQGAPAAKKAQGKKVPALIVRASVPRFRRAGLEFGHQERALPLSQLTDDQVKALKAEPRLTVKEGTADATGGAAGDE